MKQTTARAGWLLMVMVWVASSAACGRTQLRNLEASDPAPADREPVAGQGGGPVGAAGTQSPAGDGGTGGTAGSGSAGMALPGAGGAAGMPTAGAAGLPAAGAPGDPEPPDLVAPPSIDTEPGVDVSAGLWLGETRMPVICTPSSRRVTLQLWQDGAAARGVIVFGEAEPPPAASDPEQAYPPGVGWEACRGQPVDGFAYTIRAGHVDATGRFSFRVAVDEAYHTWCELQESHPWIPPGFGPAEYKCIPQLNVREREACGFQRSDCAVAPGKFQLCTSASPCDCSSTGCNGRLDRTLRFDVTMDAAVMRNASNMAGLITNLGLGDEPPIEVRLRRLE